jgi:cytochrome c peroxidase
VMFTNAARWVGSSPSEDPEFFNTGLYNIDGAGAYPAPNTGLKAITGVASDMGKFKVPDAAEYRGDVPVHARRDGGDVVGCHLLRRRGRRSPAGPAPGSGAPPVPRALVGGFTISAAERRISLRSCAR